MTTSFNDRVDGIVSSKAIKVPVRVATTANITLSGLQTIDGVTVVADDRVLVKDQDTATENGIYKAASGAWVRGEDFDGLRDIAQGTFVRVSQGSTLANTMWELTTSDPVIGTSSLTFARTDVTLSDAELLALAGLTSAADQIPYFTGSGTAGLLPTTAVGRALLNDTADEAKVTLDIDSVGANLASAAELGVNVAGRFHHVTGTTTITSFADHYSGAYKELEFDGSLTLTHSSSLQLKEGADITTQAGDRSGWRQEDGSGTWVNLWYTPASPIKFSTFLRGLELGEIAASATSITVTAGEANDSTDARTLTLSSAMSKVVADSWVAGTGNGGLSSSLTMASDTWYYVFIVRVGGSEDIMLDTSATCANGVTDHTVTHYRRIGAVHTNSPSALESMQQEGDFFQWTGIPPTNSQFTVGTSGVDKSVHVPPDVPVVANLKLRVVLGAATNTWVGKAGTSVTVDEENSVVYTTAGSSVSFVHFTMYTATGSFRLRQDVDTGGDTIFDAISWRDRRGKQY